MCVRSSVLALAAALVAAGCGERPEPVAGKLSPYPVTVAGAGERPTVLSERPERIVALGAGGAELVAWLGAEGRVVGVPAGVRVGRARSVVRPSGRIDVEAVVGLEPDLVLATPSLDPVDVALAARRSDAALYVQPDGSVDEVERAALELGLVVGAPARARRLVTSLRRRLAEIEAEVSKRAPVRVFIDEGFLVTPPEHSLVADLVRRAGGANVASASSHAQSFRPCRVARLRPKVVLHVYEASEVRAPPPRFRGCGVPRRALPRVVPLPAALVARPGPRIAQGLAAIARALHPAAFRE